VALVLGIHVGKASIVHGAYLTFFSFFRCQKQFAVLRSSFDLALWDTFPYDLNFNFQEWENMSVDEYDEAEVELDLPDYSAEDTESDLFS